MTYLNKEKLTEELNKTPMIAQHIDCMDLFDAINIATVENVAEVIRCKDCIYWQDNNNGYPHIDCKWKEDETPDPDDFCSAGERKEGR